MIEMNEMKKVLTIAGSDCSGGAGIQADIKTITAHKMYAMSAITALTAQNTTGVCGILDAGADFVGRQLDCIFQDIYPDAVKIGMVANKEIIEMIAHKLVEYKAKNIVGFDVFDHQLDRGVAVVGVLLHRVADVERLHTLDMVVVPVHAESDGVHGGA